MAVAREDLYETLHEHLQQVQSSPELQLDAKLLEECEVFLAPLLVGDVHKQAQLVAQIASLLPQLQQQPGPLVRLLQQLSQGYSFSQIMSMQPSVDFVTGLSLEAEPYNALMISLILKAAESPSEVALLANSPAIVQALFNVWLLSPEMGISEAAGEAIIQLLSTDREPTQVPLHGIGDVEMTDSSKPTGQGLLWRRIFADKDVYGLILSACGRGPVKTRSLAQARLMSLAPRVGKLDWNYLTRSHHPGIEEQYGLDPSKEGLLDFIAVHMVDYKKDVLIHINLIHFFADLITHVQQPSTTRHLSVSLQYLQEHGLHDRTISHWLKPDDPSHDPLDQTFLYGPAAHYYSTYASLYPTALLQDHTLREATDGLPSALLRLSRALSLTSNAWVAAESPKHDLHVLVSLPRAALLPYTPLGTGRSASPLLLLPIKNTNTDVLRALATILHGPESSSTPPETERSEQAAARALYALYTHYHPELFADLATHASTVALPEKALAAFALLTALATAPWAPLPAENAYNPASPAPSPSALPSEETLQTLLPSASGMPRTTGATGLAALLASPVRERVFPFLLRPPQTFAHLVGGRGDPESSAYRVALAKWDCVNAVLRALRGVQSPGPVVAGLRAAFEERVAQGVWGSPEAAAGSVVATLEL